MICKIQPAALAMVSIVRPSPRHRVMKSSASCFASMSFSTAPSLIGAMRMLRPILIRGDGKVCNSTAFCCAMPCGRCRVSGKPPARGKLGAETAGFSCARRLSANRASQALRTRRARIPPGLLSGVKLQLSDAAQAFGSPVSVLRSGGLQPHARPIAGAA